MGSRVILNFYSVFGREMVLLIHYPRGIYEDTQATTNVVRVKDAKSGIGNECR